MGSLKSNLHDVSTLLEKSRHSFNGSAQGKRGLITMSLKQIPNYKAIHYERKTNKRGGWVLTYIRNKLNYRTGNDLCIQ